MARTMEIKLVLSGMQQATAGMRQMSDLTRQLTASGDVRSSRGRVPSANLSPVIGNSVANAGPRFFSGPEQKLRKIEEQRLQLPQVASDSQRQAIAKDLDRAEFLAKRSIVLHQRRMENPEESLNRPGLLELFGEMNGLLKAMTQGNAVGVVQQLARGIQLISNTGGLNISQKLARANLPIPAGAPTLLPTGSGASPQVAGAMAPMLTSLGKMGAVVLAVVAVLAVLALAVAATVAAVKTFSGMLLSTAQALAEFHRSVLLSGGNEQSAAFLSQLGLGAANAQGFRGGLDDPLAQATAASVGVRTGGPMPFGRMDSGKMLEDFIRNVAAIEDPMQRMRKALLVGQPELIEQIELYRRHSATIKADTAVTSGVFDKESTQAAADFQFQLGRVGQAFQNIMFALSKPFLKDASKWLKGFADTLQQAAVFVNQHGAMIKQQLVGVFVVFYNLVKWLTIIIGGILTMGTGTGPLMLMFAKLEELSKKWLGAPDQSSALDANTAATQANTAAMQAGTHGGGDRARGAIPAHLKGILLERALAGRALAAGAYAL